MQLLVEKGAILDTLSSWACGTPLQAAAAGGHIGAVDFLLKNGANDMVQNSITISLPRRGSVQLAQDYSVVEITNI